MKKIIILFLTAMICISIHGQANDLSSTYKCNFLGADNKQ